MGALAIDAPLMPPACLLAGRSMSVRLHSPYSSSDWVPLASCRKGGRKARERARCHLSLLSLSFTSLCFTRYALCSVSLAQHLNDASLDPAALSRSSSLFVSTATATMSQPSFFDLSRDQNNVPIKAFKLQRALSAPVYLPADVSISFRRTRRLCRHLRKACITALELFIY